MVLAKVVVPEAVTIPSVVAKPLIVPVTVTPVPENSAVAVPVLVSKVMAVTDTVLANLPNEASEA